MAYATEGDIEKFLLHDIDSSFSGQVTTWLALAKEWIDNYCNTTFEEVASSVRYFDGNGSPDLPVDEFHGNPVVKLLDSSGNTIETLTEGTDFVCYPLNNTVKNSLSFTGPSGLISDRQLIDGESGRGWPRGTKSVSVEVTWGHSAVPEAVKQAAIQIVARILNQGLRGGDVKAESLGSYSVTYQDIDETAMALGLKSLLFPYKVIDV